MSAHPSAPLLVAAGIEAPWAVQDLLPAILFGAALFALAAMLRNSRHDCHGCDLKDPDGDGPADRSACGRCPHLPSPHGSDPS